MTKKAIIIGGGIAGLAAAHRLAELDRTRDILLLEAESRFGGLIETSARDGFLMESGPDAFISEKPWALELCRRLGLDGELIPTRETSRRSFIYSGGKLHPVPEGFYMVAPSSFAALVKTRFLSWKAKFRMAMELCIPPRKDESDESVTSFIRRRFGSEALERLGQPMIAGIYTADPENLSMQSALPQLWQLEKKYGSVIRGLRHGANGGLQDARRASGPRYSLFMSLKNGLQTLVDALAASMPPGCLKASSRVEGIERIAQGWQIRLDQGDIFAADAICLALPAHHAVRLLKRCASDVAECLSCIPYESVATVNAAYRRGDIPRSMAGFGFVIPAVEKKGIIGCTFSSVKFPGRAQNDGDVLLRAFVGGALNREAMAMDDQAMQSMVLEHFRECLGIEAVPLFVSIKRFYQAMPQYRVGHAKLVEKIEERLKNYPGLYLTGNAYRGIGLPDVIHHAEETAERMIHERL